MGEEFRILGVLVYVKEAPVPVLGEVPIILSLWAVPPCYVQEGAEPSWVILSKKESRLKVWPKSCIVD